ncbi:MAG: hypothetical protein C0502_03865 [Opitutus sp.]|nr:hypothetical protein [Opitutus sp.]
MKATHSSCARRGFSAFKLLLGLAACCLGLAAVWILVLPSVVVSAIHAKTGFAVKLDSLAVNPFAAKVRLRGLVLQNPAGWPEGAFVDLREFRADADLFPLLGGKLMADEVVVDIAQVTLVRNKQGELNAVVFKDALAGGKKPETAPAAKPGAPAGQDGFLIRRLNLRFDRLVHADHSGRSPSVKVYDLHLERELRDVDSFADLVSPFKGAALGVVSDALGGMFSGASGLLQNARGLLREGGDLLKDAGKRAGDTVKDLMQQLEKKKP